MTATERSAAGPDITVVIPVTERFDPIREVFGQYRGALLSSGKRCEFLYVLDGNYADVYKELAALQGDNPEIRIIRLGRSFGEATALAAGFEHARAPLILTLPAYLQIDPQELPRLIAEVGDADVLLCRRTRRDTGFNRLASKLFHWPIRAISGLDLHDLGCGVRLIKKEVAIEIRLYGDQHRFLPLLANRQGFRVRETAGRQADSDAASRLYSPGVYLRRLLDLLSIYFLTRFTKKPLRFFGLVGSASFAAGALILLILGVQRVFFHMGLADRPMLLLASLLLVLGIQVFALGLIAEIIIFTQSRNIPEYTVAEIVESTGGRPAGNHNA